MTGTFTKTKVLITVMTYPHPSDTHQERHWLAGLASRWGTSLGAVIPGGNMAYLAYSGFLNFASRFGTISERTSLISSTRTAAVGQRSKRIGGDVSKTMPGRSAAMDLAAPGSILRIV